MGYVHIRIKVHPAEAQRIVAEAFSTYGFRVSWKSSMKGKAKKGSKGRSIAFGWLAQHYVINFEIHPSQGWTILQLIKGNTGLGRGLVGMVKVDDMFVAVSDDIANWMRMNHLLLGYQRG